jgi:hypothetical protein
LTTSSEICWAEAALAKAAIAMPATASVAIDLIVSSPSRLLDVAALLAAFAEAAKPMAAQREGVVEEK